MGEKTQIRWEITWVFSHIERKPRLSKFLDKCAAIRLWVTARDCGMWLTLHACTGIPFNLRHKKIGTRHRTRLNNNTENTAFKGVLHAQPYYSLTKSQWSGEYYDPFFTPTCHIKMIHRTQKWWKNLAQSKIKQLFSSIEHFFITLSNAFFSLSHDIMENIEWNIGKIKQLFFIEHIFFHYRIKLM